jgi:hypothetical protein
MQNYMTLNNNDKEAAEKKAKEERERMEADSKKKVAEKTNAM